jgi:hypothetical protein
MNMRKVCAKIVPKTFTHEQKDNKKDICPDITKQTTEQLDVSKCHVAKCGFFNMIWKQKCN